MSPSPISITTERLILRPWRDEDFEPFAALTSDPEVMEFLGGTISREKSDAIAQYLKTHIETHSFGFWAIELPGEASFIGFTGLLHLNYDVHFAPAVEIGWRIARPFWGKGYVSEAARASVAHGFGPLALDEIVALTVPDNLRSRAVMERLGMTRNPDDDFDHPRLPEGHPLRRHVLYRLSRT